MKSKLLSVARLLLAGIVFVSGVPAAAPLPAQDTRWEAEIKAIESRQAEEAKKADDAVVFVGSSSVRLWTTLQADFPGRQVFNHGFGGSKLIDSVAYLDRIVVPLKPKMVVLYAGSNDLGGGATPEQVSEDFMLFARLLRERLPATRILYVSIAPNPARWSLREKMQETNRRIAEQIKNAKNMEFVDVWPAMLGEDGLPLPDIFVKDGLHMNAKGYAIWTKVIGPRL